MGSPDSAAVMLVFLPLGVLTLIALVGVCYLVWNSVDWPWSKM